MANDTDKVKVLYNTLKNDGYDDIGSEEQFRTAMHDKNKTQVLYNSLKRDGYDDIGTYDEFHNALNTSPSTKTEPTIDKSEEYNAASSKVSAADMPEAKKQIDSLTKPNWNDMDIGNASSDYGKLNIAKATEERQVNKGNYNITNPLNPVNEPINRPVTNEAQVETKSEPKKALLPDPERAIPMQVTDEMINKYPWLQGHKDEIIAFNKDTKEPFYSYQDDKGQYITPDEAGLMNRNAILNTGNAAQKIPSPMYLDDTEVTGIKGIPFDIKPYTEKFMSQFNTELDKLHKEGGDAYYKSLNDKLNYPTGYEDAGAGLGDAMMAERAQNEVADPKKAITTMLQKYWDSQKNSANGNANVGGNGNTMNSDAMQRFGNYLYKQMEDELIRRREPKSNWGFIIQNAIANSDLGKLYNTVTKTDYENWLDEAARKQHNASFTEELLSGLGTFGLNAWELAGMKIPAEALSQGVSKLVTRRAAQRISEDLMARGLAKEEAAQIAERAINVINKNSLNAIKSSVSGATMFGGMGAMNSGTQQATSPMDKNGQTVQGNILSERAIGKDVSTAEEQQRLKAAQLSKLNPKEIGTAILKGGAWGALGGSVLVGSPIADAITSGKGLVAKVAGDIGGLTSDAIGMTSVDYAQKLTEDPNFKLKDITAAQFAKDVLKTGANLLTLKLPGTIGKIVNYKNIAAAEKAFNISEQDKLELENWNKQYHPNEKSDFLSNVIRLATENRDEMSQEKSSGNENGIEKGTFDVAKQETIKQTNRELKALLQDPTVSEEMKRKMLHLITGQWPAQLSPVTDYNVNKNDDGSVDVDYIAANGSVVAKRSYNNDIEAQKAIDKDKYVRELNEFAAIDNTMSLKDIDSDAYRVKYEHDRGLQEGTVENALKGHEKNEISKMADKANTIDIGNGKYRTTREQNILDNYREEAKNFILNGDNVNRQQIGSDYVDETQDYQQGYDAADEQKADINTQYQTARQAAQQTFGERYGKDGELNDEAIRQDLPLMNDEEKNVAISYLKSKSAYTGMIHKVQDDIDTKVKTSDDTVDSHAHKQDGLIHPATMMNNKSVYIINGNVVWDDAGGRVDEKNSDDTVVIFDPEKGKPEMVSPADIMSMDEPIDAVQEKQNAADAIREQTANEEAVKIEGSAKNNEELNSDGYKPVAPREYSNGENVTLRTKEGIANGNIIDVDGNNYIIQTDKPIDGETINAFTSEQLNNMSVEPIEKVNQANKVDKVENTTTSETQPSIPSSPTMDRIPKDASGEPIYDKATPEDTFAALTEQSNGNEKDATDVATIMSENALNDVKTLERKKPKGRTPAEILQSKKDIAQALQDANTKAAYWQTVIKLSADREEQRKAAELKTNAEAQAKRTDEAIKSEQQRKKDEEKKQKEREAVGNENPMPAITEKWNNAPKIDGIKDDIVLPNGENVSGHYVLTESGAASASHNALKVFSKTEGFPIDENNNTVNDRDYEKDTDAQKLTRNIASNYDSRALQTPVVVSQDGVVLSGNGRTMAGEIAANENTDSAYIDYVRKHPEKYGFTEEQVNSLQHPRVLFVPDERMPYTAETFAKFNQQEMKSQNKTEQAVKLGKIVDNATFNRIIRSINSYDTLGDFYNNPQATREAIKELVGSGVISQAQTAEMFDGEGISAQGREILENTLIGKAFETNPDAVRMITEFKSMRQSIITALSEISNNKALNKDYTLSDELSQAVALVYEARKAGVKLGDRASVYARQGNLFQLDDGATVADYKNAIVMMLSDVLNDTRITQLKKLLAIYNDEAKDSANGQTDMFSDGVRSKEDIINDVLKLINYGTEEQQQSAITGATERRKEESVQQNGIVGQGNEESPGEINSIHLGKKQDNEGKVIAELSEPTQSDAAADVSKPQVPVQSGEEPINTETATTSASKDNELSNTKQEKAEKNSIEQARADVEVNPTDGQKEAGNYKKGHLNVDGYDITLENPKGSVRSGKDSDGEEWHTTMHNDYGYIRGTEGVDGDHIDIFLSDKPEEGNVYVVDQVNTDGSFDEHKVMYGFNSLDEARKAYLSNYSKGWKGLGTITPVSKDEFKQWIESSHRKTKPFAEYSSVKPIVGNNKVSEIGKVEEEQKENTIKKAQSLVKEYGYANDVSELTEDDANSIIAIDKVIDEADNAYEDKHKKREDEQFAYIEEHYPATTTVNSSSDYAKQMGLRKKDDTLKTLISKNNDIDAKDLAEYDKVLEEGTKRIETILDKYIKPKGIENNEIGKITKNENVSEVAKKDDRYNKLLSLYNKLKDRHPDVVLLIHEGNKYITVDNDAKDVAGILNILPTEYDSRVVAFNDFDIDKNLAKLIKAGKRVAINNSTETITGTETKNDSLIERLRAKGDFLPMAEDYNEAVSEYSRLNNVTRDEALHAIGQKTGNEIADLLEKGKKTAENKSATTETTQPKPVTEQSKAVTKQPQKTTKQTSNIGIEQQKKAETDKIDDWGEEIAGARKNALKGIYNEINNVTLQDILTQSLNKILKSRDYQKMVEKGELSPTDARILEAITRVIKQNDKPRITASRTMTNRRNKEKLDKWSQKVFNGLELMRRYTEADTPEKRKEVEKLIFSELNHDATKEYRKNLEQWNEGKVAGNKFTPNPVKFMVDVLDGIGYPTKNAGKAVVPTIDADTWGEYYTLKHNDKYIGAYKTYEDALAEAIRYAKITRGDKDIDYGKDDFRVMTTKSTLVPTGKYTVSYHKTLHGALHDRTNMTKEDADFFVESVKEQGGAAFLFEEKVRKGVNYGIWIHNEADNTRYLLEDAPKFDTKEEADAYLDDNMDDLGVKANEKVSSLYLPKDNKSGTTVDLHINWNHKTNTYNVSMPTGRFNGINLSKTLVEGLKTREEAQQWVKTYKPIIEQSVLAEQKAKHDFVFFTPEKERKGTDWRKGKDISPEELGKTFDFRGVQFGNWTNQRDRQNSINETYDALMDMANVLGVSPKALSLNGELGIAFGARGTGKFNAHYEPSEVVINLTKTRGAGSLAHEWWHALDNYFARQNGASLGMVTDGTGHAARQEVQDAYSTLAKHIQYTDYDKRSVLQGVYWGSKVEETARLFGEWMNYEQAARKEVNSFLSRGIDPEKFEERRQQNYDFYKIILNISNKSISEHNDDIETGKIKGEKIPLKEPMPYSDFIKTEEALRGMPYPTEEEVKEFSDDIRNLFNTVMEKEGDNGNKMLFDIENIKEDATPEQKEVANVLVGKIRNAGIEVSTDENEFNNVVREAQKEHETLQKLAAFHGSGATFDKFDFSHMGEGEGAQAYGWGGYVTEDRNIGKYYASTGNKKITWKGEDIITEQVNGKDHPVYAAYNALNQEGTISKAKTFIEKLSSYAETDEMKRYWNDVLNVLNTSKKSDFQLTRSRNLYTVNIPEDNGKNYLQWNKQYSKEEYRSILDKLYKYINKNGTDVDLSMLNNFVENNIDEAPINGKDLYNNLVDGIIDAQEYGNKSITDARKHVSEILNKIGYNGISYPAEYLSGGRKDGTKNYVIFNDKDIKITNREQFLKTTDGEIYGVVKDGKIYLNPKKLNPNTTVHEYTHIWDTAFKQKYPEQWKQGKELMKKLPLWNQIKSDKAYADIAGDEDLLASEVHSRLSGTEAGKIFDDAINEAKKKGTFAEAEAHDLVTKIKNWLNKIWDWVKSAFTPLSREDIRQMSLKDFVNMPIRDLLNEKRIDDNAPTEETVEQYNKDFATDNELIRDDNGNVIGVKPEVLEEIRKEKEQIVTDAKKNGTYLKAPNGKDTKLNEEQWITTRTKRFKTWFGDWEKPTRIEKLKKSNSIEITGDEITPSDDLKQYKKNALEYGKKLRDKYINKETGQHIFLGRSGVKEVLNHDYKNKEQIQSVAAIPSIIENSIYIDSMDNTNPETNKDVSKYHYYVCGLKIGKEDYTVRAVIAEHPNGERYYDHKLSKIEKGKLLDSLSGITTPGFNQKESLLSVVKDTKLFSILQINSSKIVDENGEPKVMYHNTDSNFNTFDEKLNGTHNDAGWLGDGFYFYGDKNEGDGYGKNKMEVFLNIKEPYYATSEENNSLAEQNDREASIEFRNNVEEEGYDGVYYDGDLRQETVAYNSNQIKSATENEGTFSEDSNDIRYRETKTFADGEELQIKDIDGKSSVDALNETFDSKDNLLDALRNKYENYVFTSDGDKITVEPWSKYLGSEENGNLRNHKNPNEEHAKEAYIERKTRRAQQAVDDIAKKLNINNVEVITTTDDLTGRKARAKGWYDIKNDKITIVLPNHTSVNDVVVTMLHEGVSHHGLRELFGEHFDTFLDNAFNNAEESIKSAIENKQAEIYWKRLRDNSFTDEQQKDPWNAARREATEEYLSDLAKDTNFEQAMKSSWWTKVKNLFLEMLTKVGLKLKIALSDSDFRYILWRSYENMKNPGERTIFKEAEDIDMQNRLKVGNYKVDKVNEIKKVAEEQKTDNNILFRDGEDSMRRPQRRRTEGQAEYLQRLREWEKWKRAKENGDNPPDEQVITNKWENEYKKAEAEWRRKNNVPSDYEAVFPKRGTDESPQEFAKRVADFETQNDKLKDAPNYFDFMKKANDEYREAYTDWKIRNDIDQTESVDDMLYRGEGEPEPKDEDETYNRMDIDGRMNRDLAQAEGMELDDKGAKRETKNSVIERRKDIESASAEDAIFIHDITKRTNEIAKKLGVTGKELRAALPFIIERNLLPDDEEITPVTIANSVNRTGEKKNKDGSIEQGSWTKNHISVTADDINLCSNEIDDFRKTLHGGVITQGADEKIKRGDSMFLTDEEKTAINNQNNAAKVLSDKLNSLHPENPPITVNDILNAKKSFNMQVGTVEHRILPDNAQKIYDLVKDDEDVKNIIDNIETWYDNFFHYIEDAGLRNDAGYLPGQYVNHIWDKEASDPKAYAQFVENYQRTKSPNMRHRKIMTYQEGIDLGLVPKFTDIADMMAWYSRSNIEAVANKRFLDNMNFIYVTEPATEEDMPMTFKLLTTEKPGNDMHNYYSEPFYVPGNGDVWIYKPVKSRFASIFGPQRTAGIPEWMTNTAKVLDTTSSTMKKIQLTISGFHAGALTEVALAQMRPDRGIKALTKYIIYDCLANKTTPAFAHPEDFKLAAKHLVQLGATQDYSASDVNNITGTLKKHLEEFRDSHPNLGTDSLALLTEALDWTNRGFDKMLWNYLHDGLKLACFKMFSEQINSRVNKENLDEQTREKLLDEAGQYVNDTFGGQYWELLNVSPAAIKWLRRCFLSPDWLVSTQRHFLSTFGFGSLYSEGGWMNYLKYNAKNIERSFGADVPRDEFRRFRSKNAKQCYLLGVGLFFYPLMNAINAFFRRKDEEKEKSKAEEIRKTNPDYKSPYELAYPDGMKWYDYTMLGNSIGQQTHLFVGRYKDGSEWYARWGKQFREFPEMFIGRHGLEFPAPMIERLMGKSNPAIGLIRDDLGALGIWGFTTPNEVKDIQSKYGNEIAALATTAQHFIPFSIPTQKDKEFKALDFFMPSQKGFTRYKAVDYFKTYILAGDMNGVARTYRAAVENGIDAEKTLNAAITTLKATQKDVLATGVSDMNTAVIAFNKTHNLRERKKYRDMIRKFQYVADEENKQFTKEDALNAAQSWLSGDDKAEKSSDYYLNIANGGDIIADNRLNIIEKKAKEYKAKIDANPALADRYASWTAIAHICGQAKSNIGKIKKLLGQPATTDPISGKEINDKTRLELIRTIRANAQNAIDDLPPVK